MRGRPSRRTVSFGHSGSMQRRRPRCVLPAERSTAPRVSMVSAAPFPPPPVLAAGKKPRPRAGAFSLGCAAAPPYPAERMARVPNRGTPARQTGGHAGRSESLREIAAVLNARVAALERPRRATRARSLGAHHSFVVQARQLLIDQIQAGDDSAKRLQVGQAYNDALGPKIESMLNVTNNLREAARKLLIEVVGVSN